MLDILTASIVGFTTGVAFGLWAISILEAALGCDD